MRVNKRESSLTEQNINQLVISNNNSERNIISISIVYIEGGEEEKKINNTREESHV
jgi:hypothetical protein